MRKMCFIGLAAALVAGAALAADPVGSGGRVINEYPEGSVTEAEGLANWAKFYEIASHPRCSNCHVGPSKRDSKITLRGLTETSTTRSC